MVATRTASIVGLLVLTAACGSVEMMERDGHASNYYDDGAYRGDGAYSDDNEPSPMMKKRSVIDFSDVAVEGELSRPEGAYIEQRSRSGALAGNGAPALDVPPSEELAGADTTVTDDPSSETATSVSKETPADVKKGPRLIIYNGHLSIVVASSNDARKRFVDEIVALGGHLERQDDDAVTVRVPATHFHAVIDGLTSYGAIVERHISATDVTKRVFELGVRIENAEKSRARLLMLLADAREMKDILAIENELRRLTDEIELLKGEMRTLGDQISFSTLTVTFMSNAPPPEIYGRRQSRFDWINQVGAEQVHHGF